MRALYLSCFGDSTQILAETLEVEGFGCGVIDVQGKLQIDKKSGESLFLCCDFCEDSLVNNNRLPILRQLDQNRNGVMVKDINHVIWLKVIRTSIKKVRLYICNSSGEIIPFKSGSLQCTLIFVEHKDLV